MPFTHVQQAESNHGSKIHLSHLYRYVSAYYNNPEEVEFLADLLEEALVEAKKTTTIQIVDRDGEFCFHVTPAGYIILMIPWKTFIVAEK